MEFVEAYRRFWKEFGTHKKMVLSSSQNDIVTSRMMSIVCMGEKLYFQTDKTFRKYEQIKNNPNVSLCIDNIQIDGTCYEVNPPSQNKEFSQAYQTHYPFSYEHYSSLESECVFEVTPNFIERWHYIKETPWIEQIDVKYKKYSMEEYHIK